ncbi:tRNA 2-thiouridine(34) synthase MnmA [Patescibacteria group bacterium]|nr:tRNA 2-thiouridine(34) synthase MnmA [Patescibacteria group bacterium]
MNETSKKETIAVGISGGVDSSVAAYLLKQQGYNVIGIFVKTWSPEWLPCTWVDEKRDAMRVCAALDIPFYFLDAEVAYKQGVAEYMINEYKAGRTPNPDVLCNRVIKFGVLWEYAQSLGATKIATGHYARTDGVSLMKAVDPSKDQSYFLWMITQPELVHIMFPLGHLQKNEVRKLAEEADLFTAVKKDSQGICFLGDVDMREFLSHYIEQKKGEVVDGTGAVVGEHDGVWFYTIGERHGFRITVKDSDRVPYYVVGKDIKTNKLIVSSQIKNSTSSSDTTTVILRAMNWYTKPDEHKTYTSQIRYHGALIGTEYIDEQTIKLHTIEVLPLGQSVVLYDGEKVVGAGIIESA